MDIKKETTLPLEFESFKKDLETLFSLSNEDLELIINELERKGVKFSDDDVTKIIKIDEGEAETVRILLTYLIPIIRENKGLVEKELSSLKLDIKRINFLTNKAVALREETSQTCETIFKLFEYLDYQSHVGELKGELNFAPIRINKDKDVRLLPLIKMKIRTHPGDDEALSEQISVNIEPRQLHMLIEYLQGLLSRVLEEINQNNNLLGNKVIMTLGDD